MSTNHHPILKFSIIACLGLRIGPETVRFVIRVTLGPPRSEPNDCRHWDMLSSGLASDIASSHAVGLYSPSPTTQACLARLLPILVTSRKAPKPSKRQKRGEIIMIIEPIKMAHASRNRTIGRQLLLSFIALVLHSRFPPAKHTRRSLGRLRRTSHFSSMRGTPNFRRASTSSTCSTTPI